MLDRLVTAALALICLVNAGANVFGQDLRKWSSSDEAFSVVAKLDTARTFSPTNGEILVYLVDESNRTFVCPAEKLSVADKEFLKIALNAYGSDRDVDEALAWIDDEKRAPGARRTFTVDGIEYAFRWVPRGKYSEPTIEYNPNTLKSVAAAREEARAKKRGPQTTVAPGFWMLETEVTLEMYAAFVKDAQYKPTPTKKRKLGYVAEPRRDSGVKPSEDASWRNPGFTQTKRHPVTTVTPRDAENFCKWLSKKLERPIVLPTKNQWMLASQPKVDPSSEILGLFNVWAMGSDEGWERGNLPDANFAVTCLIQAPVMSRINFIYRDSYRFTIPVGSFKPNANGLYDMVGNVGEIASDYDDVVESLGGSWFHLQNFNPINWKHINSLGDRALDDAARQYAVSRVAPIFAQNYDQTSVGATSGTMGGQTYVYSPIEDVDGTCFTGFRVIIRP